VFCRPRLGRKDHGRAVLPPCLLRPPLIADSFVPDKEPGFVEQEDLEAASFLGSVISFDARCEQSAGRNLCGELIIKRALKRRARKRKLVIDREMKEVLERLLNQSRCDSVFTGPQDPAMPLGPRVLEEQIAQVRKKMDIQSRPFTLQYVAGHDNIKTTMRHVHPREAAVHKLFARLADLQRPEDHSAAGCRCKIRCSSKCPQRTNLLKH
jgi:hypothetical protein